MPRRCRVGSTAIRCTSAAAGKCRVHSSAPTTRVLVVSQDRRHRPRGLDVRRRRLLDAEPLRQAAQQGRDRIRVAPADLELHAFDHTWTVPRRRSDGTCFAAWTIARTTTTCGREKRPGR